MSSAGKGKRQAAIIAYLRAHGATSSRELAEHFGVTQPSIASSLNALMDQGVVTRLGASRKQFRYALTGTAACEAARGPELDVDQSTGEVLCVHCRVAVERANPGRYRWAEAPPHLTCQSPGCLKAADAVGTLRPAEQVNVELAVHAVAAVAKDELVPEPLAPFKVPVLSDQFQDLNLVGCLSTVNKWLAAYSGLANDPVVVEIVLGQEHLKRALELMDERLAEYVGELAPVGVGWRPDLHVVSGGKS